MTDKKKPSMRVHQIIRQIAVRQCGDSVGCWDGSCIYGHPGGMQTNGGCGCLKERDPHRLQLHILQLRQICQTLAAMVPWVEDAE